MSRALDSFALLAALGLGVAAGCGGNGDRGGAAAVTPPPSAPPSTAGTTVSTTTTSPTSTTSTTVDPGSLPQTRQLPSADDPRFLARVDDLWNAITSGRTDLAAPAFFPLSAYIQVKAISDPVHDYQTRLIADFDEDILAIRAGLGSQASTARLTGVTVPSSAQWIQPGVEYNKGSYWRVYGTEVSYTAGGRSGSFEIHSLISWRGEWYVVHLGPIR